jgi:hypothetical protein
MLWKLSKQTFQYKSKKTGWMAPNNLI